MARADDEGLNRSDVLQAALDLYLSHGKKPVRSAVNALMRRPEPKRKPVKNCPHPPSLRLQTPGGVLCDRCGSWL